ncbi:MAG: MOSC domain-containing protein [Planctomycetota bacterium]
MEILKELLLSREATGTVEWLGFSTASRSPISSTEFVEIVRGGIRGDHHCRPTRPSRRQVTLIQAEHLPVVASLMSRTEIRPELLRRNVVVSGINLSALRYMRFRIGTAVLEGSGPCPPCSRMEENLGPGGYAAMVNHGGITAIVITEGHILLGDTVQPLEVVPQKGSESAER